MTYEREPLPHEQALLNHYREHGTGEPSSQLDARILAAAQAELQHKPVDGKTVGWSQRLHQWLFDMGRQRWGLSLAGLACLGIGVSLAWQTLQRAPEPFDRLPPSVAMAPAMPAPLQARPDDASRKASARPQAPTGVEAMARQAPVTAMADAPVVETAAMMELVRQSEPRETLLRLLNLRKAGEQDEAQRVLEQLRSDYPQLDIEAELSQLSDETR